MKKTFLIFGFLSLFFAFRTQAAENPATLTARAWPRRITVGGEVRLLVRVTHLEAFSVALPGPSLNISPFEIKSVRRLSLKTDRGMTKENFEIVVTAFKVGDLKIPPIRIPITGPGGQPSAVTTPSIDVKVNSVLPAEGGKDSGKKDIRPIKNVISLDPDLLKSLLLGGLVLILSVILAARIFLRRKKKKLAEDPEARFPAHRRAELELERLLKKDLLSSGKFKEHYSELSGILKRYLERRYAIKTPDLTTSEILSLLKKKDFEPAIREDIKEILEASDLVKFANWNPPKILSDELSGRLLGLVQRTREEDAPKERKK